MKNRATEFFKNYFKIHADEIDIYDETIDCMTKFAEREINPDVSKMGYKDLGKLQLTILIMIDRIGAELDKRNNDILTANPQLLKMKLFDQQLDNETDAAGNCFSDADNGL